MKSEQLKAIGRYLRILYNSWKGRIFYLVCATLIGFYLVLQSNVVARRAQGDPTQQWLADFLLNFGAGILVSVLIFVVFTILYFNADPESKLHQIERLDTNHFIHNKLPRATGKIRIMDNWTPLVSDVWLKQFQDSMRVLSQQKGKTLSVEVLLLHPESEAAKLRHEQRRDMNPLREMQNNVNRFRYLEKEIAPGLSWNIRLSKVPLLMDLYIVDERGRLGFYPPRHAASETPHLLFPMSNALGNFINPFFGAVFSDRSEIVVEKSTPPTVIDLEFYWRLTFEVTSIRKDATLNPRKEKDIRVKYVYSKDTYYLIFDDLYNDEKIDWVRTYFLQHNDPKVLFELRLPGVSRPLRYQKYAESSTDEFTFLKKLIATKYHEEDEDTLRCEFMLTMPWPSDIPRGELKQAYEFNPGLNRSFLEEPEELLKENESRAKTH